MPHEEIAMGLGIARNTLDKHFSEELSGGACKRRLEVLGAMFAAAKKGNVSAQRAYMAMTPRLAPPPTAPAKPAAKVGKKEQQLADAKTAGKGNEWGDLLAPAARH
jgi:hypothetical protein